MMPPKPKSNIGPIHALLVIGVWVALGLLLLYNRQGISDYWRLHNYHPSVEVSDIASADTMTPKARDVFYVNEPTITAQKAFTDNCPSGTERTVVLGCYHSNQAGIYVLKVTDGRLQGVEQVTAAHEMLHAVYDRMSRSQKHQVDAMLLDYYHHGLTDTTVKQQIDDYRHSEPNDVSNEMHSLFATEVQSLPANLESYYRQYFGNRPQVVGLYKQYEDEFTSRQAAIKDDDAQLATMKSQIESSEASLRKQSANLDSQRAQLNSERASGQIAAYNAGVSPYNSAVDAYNTQADSLRSLIASYNDLVQRRNALAAETNQLTAEISNQVPNAQ